MRGERVGVVAHARAHACDAGSVTDHSVGDRVMGRQTLLTRTGSYAEYLSVPASSAVTVPAVVSFVEAAALPIVGSTAWKGLVTLGASARQRGGL